MKKENKDELERIGGQGSLDITRDFLEWYKGYLEDEEPYAKNPINLAQAMLDDLPCEVEDLIEDLED